MAANGIFVTGFPGFIAGRLVGEILQRQETPCRFYFLILSKFRGRAQQECAELERVHPQFAGNWTLVEGDICEPNLGIDSNTLVELQKKVVDVWHLAAIYDLAVPVHTAYAANVEGTLHVLDFCASVKNLRRHFYVSTCYVAGDRNGAVCEEDLDCGQGFKNHYESTKFWAEKLVQHRWDTIPTTIFRPAIVVGDSKTGETIKGDGPYFMFQLLFKLPKWLPFAHVGPGEATLNVVPVDFLVSAMAELSVTTGTEGKVFQLADPKPYTVHEMLNLTLKSLGRAPAVMTLPDAWVEKLLEVPQIARTLGIPAQSLSYFNHSVDFDVSNTLEFLKVSGVSCPDYKEYLPKLIAYARKHPSIFGRVS